MTHLSKFPSHADEITHLMASSAEVSPLPTRRPVAVASPETRICDCQPEGVVMVRNSALDIPGETPYERHQRGAVEGFECPLCQAYELFPPEGLSLADIKRGWPGWGSRRNAGHGDAA